MPYPPAAQPTDFANETDAESGAADVAGLEAEGGTPGEGEHAARHNAIATAVNEVVAELGANPSGAEATVQARMEAMGLTLASKADTTAVTEALAAKASKAELGTEEAARISGLAGKAASTHASSHQAGGADPLALPQYDPFDLLPYIVPMGVFPGTTLGPTAKRAYFLRFTVAKKREFKFVRWAVGVIGTGAEDEVDCAIYKANGAKLERVKSSGGVKTSFLAVGVRANELTAAAVCEPGVVYFAAFSLKVISGTPQTLAPLNNNSSVSDIGGTGTLANRLMLFKAETFPLPETVEGFNATVVPWLVPSES